MLKRFFKSSLYKDVATLAGGTGIAQMLPLLISPVLTRIYTPDEFGVLAFYMAFVAIVGVASTGRYEMAILIPNKDRDAVSLFTISSFLIYGTTAILFILLLLFGPQLFALFGFEGHSVLTVVIPAGIFAYGVFQLATYMLNRSKKYTKISSAKILRSGSVSGGQLFFGFAGFSVYGLIFGKLSGDILSAAYARWQAKKEISGEDITSWGEVKSQAKIYDEFPKVNAPHAVTNTASSQLPNILLAGLFNTAAAGFYNLSYRICYAPVQLISSSVHQVFSREVSERYNSGKEIHPFSLATVKKLAITAIIPFLLLLVFAPSIFSFVFGAEWRVAGQYAQVLTPYLYFVFIVSPVTFIPMLLNRQRTAFLLDVIYMTAKIGALFLGFWMGSAFIAIAAFSFVGILFQCYLLVWILSLTKSTV